MHSRDSDLVDAREIISGYIEFGNLPHQIPEFARPIMIQATAEALSIARKQEYAMVSAILEACSQTEESSTALATVADLCRSRLETLSGIVVQEATLSSMPATSGRRPTPQKIGQEQASRDATVVVDE